MALAFRMLKAERCIQHQSIFKQTERNLAALSISKIHIAALHNQTKRRCLFPRKSLNPSVSHRPFSSIFANGLQTIAMRSNTSNNNQTNLNDSFYKHDLTFLDQIFDSQQSKSPNVSYDVLMLNAPSDSLVRKLCRHANTIICADGGANSVFNCQGGHTGFDVIPHAIVGDLDSVHDDVLESFVSKGTQKILIEDQNDNDFHKALTYLLDMQTESKYIICWGAFGDRFDHEMQGLNVLYKFKMQYDSLHPTKRMMLMTGNNFAMVLDPGKHHIKCAELQGPVCSLIPLYSKATVSTRGLQYNMDNQVLQFGGLISSSNGFVDKENVEIETDELVLFHSSCGLQCELSSLPF